MLQLSVSLCQIKSRVIICSVVRCSVDAAIMQCLYEMVRGFIAVIPRWLKRFLVMVCVEWRDLEQVVFETIRAQMCPALGIDSNKDKLDLQTVQQAEHEEKLRSIQDSKRHLYEQYARRD